MTLSPLFSQRLAKRALVSVLALSAGLAFAQQENRIQLRSLDGAMSLEGTFIGFRDGVYVLDHDSLGTLRIEGSDEIICEGAACPGNEPEPEPEPVPEVVVEVVSKAIKLATEDGRLSIEGDFVELAGNTIILDSATLGRLAIDNVPGMTCEGDACPDLAPANGQKRIVGTTREMVKFLPVMLEAFAASRDETITTGVVDEDGNLPITFANSEGDVTASFLISSGGAEDALGAIANREASYIISDRRISQDDVDRLGIPDLRGTTAEAKLAQDGLVLVTHPDNPIDSLSTQEIARIWSGADVNWQSVGGLDVPITVTSAILTASDWRVFSQAILLPNAGTTNAMTSFDDPNNFVSSIRNNPGSIGMARWSDIVQSGLKMLNVTQSCGLSSAPSAFHLQNGEYRLGQSIYSYYVGVTPSRIRLTDMANALIYTASGELDYSAAQLRQTMGILKEAERTNIAFRFKEGSSELDQDSVLAVNEMIDLVTTNSLNGYEILLVGFSDSSGGAVTNTSLAQNRALSVEQALRAALPAERSEATPIATFSAGEMLPIWCNDTGEGRERNRRVEAWIRLNPI